jgi:serine/threonine protein kinase
MIPIDLVLKDIKRSLNTDTVGFPSPSGIEILLSTTSPNAPPHKHATVDDTSGAYTDSCKNEPHRNSIGASTDENPASGTGSMSASCRSSMMGSSLTRFLTSNDPTADCTTVNMHAMPRSLPHDCPILPEPHGADIVSEDLPLQRKSDVNPTQQNFTSPFAADAPRSQQFDRYGELTQRIPALESGKHQEHESNRRQTRPSATQASLKMLSGFEEALAVPPRGSALATAYKDDPRIVGPIENKPKARGARHILIWNTKRSEFGEEDEVPNFTGTKSKVPEEQHAEHIRKTIESKMKTNWENKKYISRTDLEAIFTESTIRTLISEDESLRNSEFKIAQHECAVDADAMASEILTSASRLLALCVYVDLPLSCLHSLMGRGITDLYLPLSEVDCPDPKYATRWGFLTMMQGGFLAHHFDDNLGISKYRQLDSRIVVPIMFNEHNDRIGEGSFGVVHKVSIDPDHHNFSSDRTITFALKRFFEQGQRTQDDFARESRMLQMLSQVASPHITPHLASWTQNDKFYMLFPRAECNLRTYLRRKMPPVLDKRFVLWLLAQLHGLADAVRHIHNLGSLSLKHAAMSTEGCPGENFKYTGFHHDIKPDNILVFDDGSNAYGTLKIGDFGSGKFGRALSGGSGISQESYFTDNLGDGDETYGAPDRTIEGKMSRPYDLWSLGCVFLEMVAGFLQTETSGLDDFASARRKTSDTIRHSSSAFWYIDTDCKARLKPAVVDKLAQLSSLCSGKRGFEQLIRSIRKMLTLSPSDRITAPELCNELYAIQIQAEVDTWDNPDDYIRPNSSDAVGSNKSGQCSFEAGGEDDSHRFGCDVKHAYLRDEEVVLDLANETLNKSENLSETGLGQVVQEGLLEKRKMHGEVMEKQKELNQTDVDAGNQRHAAVLAGLQEEIQKKDREHERSMATPNTNSELSQAIHDGLGTVALVMPEIAAGMRRWDGRLRVTHTWNKLSNVRAVVSRWRCTSDSLTVLGQ